MNKLDTSLKAEAVELVSRVFGDSTAALFSKCCENQNPKEVLQLLHEILRDYIGATKAEQEVKMLSERYGY